MTDDLPDHTNYSLIKAVDELGNLVTVLADSSGRIVSVMKGDYAGTMKTLAVDSQGRIQAVLTDPEDVFGNPSYMGAAELATRLGSIDSFERRGNVIFMDDFESSTLKWTTSGTGTGHSEVRSNESARSGNFALKLITGNAAGDLSYIIHHCPPSPPKRFGIEFSFALGTYLDEIKSTIVYRSTVMDYTAEVIYHPQTDLLTLVEDGGGSITIASGLILRESDFVYHTWKVVVDIATEQYVRVFLDQVEYDISAYSLQKYPGSYVPTMGLDARIKNYSAGNHYAYIDDVIFTHNEP